jgi:hypothetical protein
MNRRLRAPSPAFVVALIALFVGLGGGAALADGLISGKQLANHSIPEKKLTAKAIKALKGQRGPAGPQGARGAVGPQGTTGPQGPQGPGAISINKHVLADSDSHTLVTIDGLDVYYVCGGAIGGYVEIGLEAHSAGDKVFASGDKDEDGGALVPVQEAAPSIGAQGSSKENLDVIAWAGSVGTLWRFDLGVFYDGSACNIWGLIIPASAS